jgi:hypothetical protein
MDTKKLPTKTVISNHDRARVEKAFELIRCGFTVTTLSFDEMKAIVLRALAKEFDHDIELKHPSGAKLSLHAVPEERRISDPDLQVLGFELKIFVRSFQDRFDRDPDTADYRDFLKGKL